MHKTAAWPLALLYSGLIVYASLYPFAEWRDQGIAPWTYLFTPLSPYWTWFDVAINVIGYGPLGGLLALASVRSGGARRVVLVATLCGLVLSLFMETLQNYLPARVPSNVDLFLNLLGTWMGAVGALVLERMGAIDRWSRLRLRWFVDDARGALVLIALWPFALLFPAAVPLGLGQAATVRVGHAFGARDPAAISRAGWAAFGMAMAFVAGSALLMGLAPRLLISAFLDTDAPGAPAVIGYAVGFVRMAALFQFADGAQAALSNMLRGVQDSRVPLAMALIGYWGVGAPLGLALAFFTPLEGLGLWIGIATGLLVVSVMLFPFSVRRTGGPAVTSTASASAITSPPNESEAE